MIVFFTEVTQMEFIDYKIWLETIPSFCTKKLSENNGIIIMRGPLLEWNDTSSKILIGNFAT